MKTEYAVLLPGNENAWARATMEERKAVYAQHTEFARLLEERGHSMTGGAELTHSKDAIQVRGELDRVSVTEGPYAETTEQITGFYLVRTDNVDDLLQLCGLLAGAEGVVEVRAVVADSDPEATS